MSSLVPPLSAAIQAVTPYRSARMIIKGDDLICLDACECPSAPIYDVTDLALNRYPDPLSCDLRFAIGEFYRLDPNSIFLGCGVDELLDMGLKAFGDERGVVSFFPTYPLYALLSTINGKRYASVPLREDFSLDEDTIEPFLPKADVLILCSPNSPTGTVLPMEQIARLVEKFPGLVLVDEAYGEFADAQGLPSAITLVQGGAKNLLVLRTFSKAFRGAGIRLGYAIACTEIIEGLLRVKLPYNVNALTQHVGPQLWKKREQMEENVRTMLRECRRLAQGCRELGCTVSDSKTHFFLLQFPDGVSADEIYARLRDEYRIVARPFGIINGRGSLRMSCGTREQNNLVLTALKKFLPSS